MQRDLAKTIQQMLAAIPESVQHKESMVRSFYSHMKIHASLCGLYAPEEMSRLWDRVGESVRQTVTWDASERPDWQNAILAIWTGKA